MDKTSPIGVFDSGLGGISVLSTLHTYLPHEDFYYMGDSKFNPYGNKKEKEIIDRCIEICDTMMEAGVKMIVVACNTATSAAVHVLRKRYPIDIVGMEPALKVAAEENEQQTIAVWATEFTLKEKKFADLMKRFDKEHTIYKVPAPQLVRIVEEDALDHKDRVDMALNALLEQSNDAKALVLGCTHYVFFKKHLKEMVGDSISVIDGNLGTSKQVEHLLKEKNLLNEQGNGKIDWHNSLPEKIDLSKTLYKRLEEQK